MVSPSNHERGGPPVMSGIKYPLTLSLSKGERAIVAGQCRRFQPAVGLGA
jgi:hypothetical protein